MFASLLLGLACADDDSPTGANDNPPPEVVAVVLRTGLWQTLGSEDFGAGVPAGPVALSFSAQISADSLLGALLPAVAGAGTVQAELELPAGRLCRFAITASDGADAPLYRSVRYGIASEGDTLTLDMVDANDVDAPELIGDLEIAVLGSGELALSWPPPSEGGAPAPSASCLVWTSARALPDVSLPTAAAGPGATGLLVSGLVPGGDYEISVAAVDGAGNIGAPITGQASLPPASFGLYVDVATGMDAPGHGSSSQPFKTISYALAQTNGDEPIYIAGGDYGEGSGESFPLIMKSGTRLFGAVAFAAGRPLTTIMAPPGDAVIVVTDTGVIRGLEILCPSAGLLRAIDARAADLWASWLRLDGQGGTTSDGITAGGYLRVHDSVFLDFGSGRAVGLFGNESAYLWGCSFLRCQTGLGMSGHHKTVLNCFFDACGFGLGASGFAEGETGDLFFSGLFLRDCQDGLGLVKASDVTVHDTIVWEHASTGIRLTLCFEGILIDGCQVDGGSTGVYVADCAPTIHFSNLVCNRINLYVDGDQLVDARDNRWDHSPPLVAVRPDDGPCEDSDICYDGDYSGTPEPLWSPEHGTSDCISFTAGPLPTRELPAALGALRRGLGLR